MSTKPSKNKGVSTHEPIDVKISHNPASAVSKIKNIEIDRGRWSKFAFEFLSIFVAVISAFALNNWNDNRKDNVAEHNILEEISNGLEKDIKDTELNVMGHKYGLMACQFWRKVINDQAVNSDSIQFHYFNLLRDFISAQNTSGYENLKSRGLELIKNDSLRTAIISLYEYDYKTLKTLEEDYFEMQFHENYFKEFNELIAPNFQFDINGNILSIKLPLHLNMGDKNKLLSYLWKVESNRNFALQYYQVIETNIKELIAKIEKEKK